MSPVTTRRSPTPDEVERILRPPPAMRGWLATLIAAAAAFIIVFLVVLLLVSFIEGPPPWAVSIAVLAGAVAGGAWSITTRRREQSAEERAAVERATVAAGEVVATRYEIQDAIAVEEFEDEGLSYYLLLDDSRTLFLSGQYLYEPADRGFPWKTFEVVRIPGREWVLNVVKLGDSLKPSHTRPPFTGDEFRSAIPVDGTIASLDWSSLRTAAA